MLIRHVALVSQTSQVDSGSLSVVAAALQKQVTRDFAPLWNINATVDAFASLDHVPVDYWHVLILDDIERADQAGYHQTENGQPVALVQFDDDWSITASHETLEMLADPFGNALVAGESPVPGQGRVQYIQEICDPCRSSTYSVNNVSVSDFCTPNYFDPLASPGMAYSYSGKIRGPRELLPDGYLAFIEPVSGHIFQLQRSGAGNPSLVDLSAPELSASALNRGPAESLREFVDRRTPQRKRRSKRSREFRDTAACADRARQAQERHAREIQRLIDQFRTI
jgi:hypothetical protein